MTIKTAASQAKQNATEGPWQAERSIPQDGFDCWYILAPHREGHSIEIATVRGGAPTSEGNARIMAAGWEMLAALQDIIARNEIQQWFNLDKAKAAVAKATREIGKWEPIETAPKGMPTENVGERSGGPWFWALKKDGAEVKLRRLWSGHTFAFENEELTYYAKDWFTHWKPLAHALIEA